MFHVMVDAAHAEVERIVGDYYHFLQKRWDSFEYLSSGASDKEIDENVAPQLVDEDGADESDSDAEGGGEGSGEDSPKSAPAPKGSGRPSSNSWRGTL